MPRVHKSDFEIVDTGVLDEAALRECVRGLLIEAGILDKFKGWMKEVPAEAKKIWEKLKQEALESKDLAVILMKMATGKEVSDEEKLAVQDQLADIGKGAVFASSLVAPGMWPLVADIFMIGAEETGVSFRPTSFKEWEPFMDEPVDVEEACAGPCDVKKEGKLRVSRKRLREIIREAVEENELLGLTGPWHEVVAEYLARGQSTSAMMMVLNSLGVDDTWRVEEDVLEDMLIDLGPNATSEQIDAVSDEWIAGVRSGKWHPKTKEEMEADWSRGAKPRTDYNRRSR